MTGGRKILPDWNPTTALSMAQRSSLQCRNVLFKAKAVEINVLRPGGLSFVKEEGDGG